MLRKKRILIIAAHPDDEVLGCGGTVAQLVKYYNYSAAVLFLSSGVGSRNKTKINDEYKRKKNALKSCKTLGIKNVYFENLPDNSFDNLPLLDICKLIEIKINSFKPDIIFTHNFSDLNIDHQLAAKATITATRFYKKRKFSIFSYEVLSSSFLNFIDHKNIFNGEYFFDISKTINLKIKALKQYKDEIRKFPHPRSVEGIKVLAKFRGMQCNLKYAECFKVIKSKNF